MARPMYSKFTRPLWELRSQLPSRFMMGGNCPNNIHLIDHTYRVCVCVYVGGGIKVGT